MTGNSSFIRKIIYFVLIAILLVPLYLISHPSTRAKDGTFDEGGTLAQMRVENDLSQANLGEIDPAGASMSLATLGMRGVAANLLWGQAIKYKKTENWDGLKATLNQITKLQPNFETVWIYQAWNLSYNVSVEFDDFRHRYHWIKKGINYLIDGTRFNRSMPSLLQEVGWFFQHKIGRADEYRQYRELFRNDKDFHAELDASDLPINMELTNGPEKKPDNWLVAYEWYRAGERLVETRDAPIRRKNPLLFFSNAAMSLMYYAGAIQKEGHINEFSQAAWRRALDEWKEFGDHGIPSRLGFDIRLNDLERMREQAAALRKKLNDLVPGVENRLREERIAGLPPEMAAAMKKPLGDRNPQEYALANQAKRRIQVSLADIALEASPDNITIARSYAKQAFDAEAAAEAIEREREVINFAYWKTRAESEQTDLAISARKHLYAADQFYKDTDLENARREYELSFQDWAKIYEKYPILIDDVEAEENYDAVQRYRKLLDQTDEAFPPEDFPLMVLLDYYDETYIDPDRGTTTATKPAEDAAGLNGDEVSAPPQSDNAETNVKAGEAVRSGEEANTTEDAPGNSESDHDVTATDDASESDASSGDNSTGEEPNALPFGVAPESEDK